MVKLQLAATWIRFNISFAVSQLARFCASAGSAQWAALHHLMEYLPAHPSFKIEYRSGMKLVDLLSGYADADWGNSSSGRPTSSMVMLYTKSPILWKSKMQKTSALTIAEATTQHRRLDARNCTSGHFCADLASGRRCLPRSTRTDNTACNEWGKAAVSGPSTLTSGSTSPTKPSRMVKYG